MFCLTASGFTGVTPRAFALIVPGSFGLTQESISTWVVAILHALAFLTPVPICLDNKEFRVESSLPALTVKRIDGRRRTKLGLPVRSQIGL
jgi:hypothetical protein